MTEASGAVVWVAVVIYHNRGEFLLLLTTRSH